MARRSCGTSEPATRRALELPRALRPCRAPGPAAIQTAQSPPDVPHYAFGLPSRIATRRSRAAYQRPLRSCSEDAAGDGTAWPRMRTPKARLAASEASTAAGGPSAATRPSARSTMRSAQARRARGRGPRPAPPTPQRAHLVQHAEELQLVADVEVRRRLVEQQHPRLLRQAAGQRRELPLAGRERARAAARPAGAMPVCSSARATAASSVGVERPERAAVRIAAERHALRDRSARPGPPPRDVTSASARASASRGHSASGRPQSRTSPAAGSSRPASARTSVDLPAAFGPTSDERLAGVEREAHAVSTRRSPRSTASAARREQHARGAHPRPSLARSASRK